MSMRSGQPGVNGNEYAQLPITLPPLPEQAAIATILSDMDAELTALEQRRDKTRALKQGMMQELLTGKTRLV
jgi:type I restriction enzyme S subunit